MDIYLLPPSSKQSSMDLVKKDLFEVWKEENNNKFLFLNPEREELIKSFGIKTYPLLPAWRRYRGSFWDNLHMWALPSAVQRRIVDRGLIPSPLFGLLSPSDLICPYGVDFKDRFEGVSLKRFWKDKLHNLFNRIFEGKLVLDLLNETQRSVVSFPQNCKVVRFKYVRAGKRVVNPLPHRAYTLRYVVEKEVNIDNLDKVNFLDYKVTHLKEHDEAIEVIMEGEGRYI